MAAIGNTVQCGVYMINVGGVTYPIPFSGDYNDLRVPNDCDDYYIVYPGFKVRVNSPTSYWCDNTTGTSPLMYAANSTPQGNQNNQSSGWWVYYMGSEITLGGGWGTSPNYNYGTTYKA